MAFTWTTLPAFILDQYASKQSINKLKDNTRYIAEDLMGDPAANGNEANFALGDFTISKEFKGSKMILRAMGNPASGSFFICYNANTGTDYYTGFVMPKAGSVTRDSSFE